MINQPLYQVEAAPYNGPQSLSSKLMDGITAAPFEGVWVPVHCVKKASVELIGTNTSLSVSLMGSNALEAPLNTYIVTVGGTITAVDTVALTFNAGQLLAGNITVTTAVTSLSTTTSIAAALATLINASLPLSNIGIVAVSALGVITITWPSESAVSEPSSTPWSPTNPPTKNNLALTSAVTGSATETVAITCGTDGSLLQLESGTSATVGLNFISQLPVRWIKVRLTSFTGTSVSATLHGTL